MTNSSSTRLVAHSVRFWPASDSRGKWHAAWKVSGTAVCGSPAPLAVTGSEWLAPEVGVEQVRVHPLVCRSCLRLTTSVGYANASSTI